MLARACRGMLSALLAAFLLILQASQEWQHHSVAPSMQLVLTSHVRACMQDCAGGAADGVPADRASLQ